MDAHGTLKLRWSGDTLYVEAVGPFNAEGTKEAAEAYVEAINQARNPTFAVIEILDSDSIGPPTAMEEVGRTWRWLGEKGCRALALVYSNLVQHQLAETHLPEFGKVFQSREDAEEWIRGRMG